MAVSLAFRFVSGAYAATAWDSSANSGTVEWPPSPWRISRALLAVAHDRLPTDDLDTVMTVLAVLASEYPIYLVPPAVPHHTRHYLPDLDHRSGETGSTTLTLNSMLSVDDNLPLYVTWPQADLADNQADCLARCISRLPYLGRAESLVEARLVADVPAAERHQVLAPGTSGAQSIRLLCPSSEPTREQLEVSPDQMRKKGYLTPPGAEWIDYAAPREEVPQIAPRRPRRDSDPTVVRWAWRSTAPLRETYGILATERLRGVELSRLQRRLGEVPVTLTGHFPRSRQGQQMVRTEHGHAHWLWLAQGGRVTDLVLWVPDGISSGALSTLAQQATLATTDEGYAPRGFVEGRLQLTGIGRPDQVASELISDAPGAVTWQSASPYLLTRHMKRSRDLWALLGEDVRAEWGYRNPGGAVVVAVEPIATGIEPRQYRRYRWKETMSDRRQGINLRLTFSEPQVGPIVLGGLAHFGFGRFRPVPGS